MSEKSGSILMYFTYESRRKREHEKYLKELNKLKNMSDTELSSEYINIKVRYTHKKNILFLFGAGIFLSILGNIWKNLFFVLKRIIELFFMNSNDIETGKAIFILSVIIFALFTIIILGIFTMLLKDLTNLHKSLLLIENVRSNNKVEKNG